MGNPEPIQYGKYYHIFNRGINSMPVFRAKQDYHHFLKTYQKYIPTVADTYAYCLMKNHFHFLIRIKEEDGIDFISENKTYNPSRQFSHLFNAYTRWFNKNHDRTGPVFEQTFKRKNIDSDLYFQQLVVYIHNNPIHHEIASDVEDYLWTSYHQLIKSGKGITKISLANTIEWFGDVDNFVAYHKRTQDISEGIIDA